MCDLAGVRLTDERGRIGPDATGGSEHEPRVCGDDAWFGFHRTRRSGRSSRDTYLSSPYSLCIAALGGARQGVSGVGMIHFGLVYSFEGDRADNVFRETIEEVALAEQVGIESAFISE